MRHPYNKGNGAAVKTGIRTATGEYVMIVDGDGQHHGERRRAAGRSGSASTTWSSARDPASTQATLARRLGNGALNWLASYLTERDIPDLTSGFRAARRAHLREFLHLLPNGFSTPTTTTLAFIKAGYNVTFEPAEARQRVGTSKIRLGRDGVTLPPDHPAHRHALQPAARLPADQPGRRSRSVPGTRSGRSSTQSHVTNSSVLLIMLAVIVFLVGLVSEQISALRFEGRH